MPNKINIGNKNLTNIQAEQLTSGQTTTLHKHEANQITIDDAGGFFTATQTEGALQETGLHISQTVNTNNVHGLRNASVAIALNSAVAGTASIAFGSNANANGTENIAIGVDASSTGTTNSISLGKLANSTGVNSTAIGKQASATGTSSFAAGELANSSQTNTIAIGKSSAASGADSISLGSEATSPGTSAIALGKASFADKTDSLAVGRGALATGTNAVALGTLSNATQNNSIAIGPDADATEIEALALGFNAAASAEQSTAIGSVSAASGLYSTAIGFTSKAEAAKSTAIGQLSLASAEDSTSIGTSSKATALNAAAFGKSAQATANDSLAFGPSSTASGLNSTAVGKGATSSQQDAISIGTSSSASAQNSISIGKAALVGTEGTNSIAIGNDVSTNVANTIQLGTSSHTVNISGDLNVAGIIDQIGDKYYSQENYITIDETVTSSLDSLDIALKDISDVADSAKSTAESADSKIDNHILEVADEDNVHGLRDENIAIGAGTTSTGSTSSIALGSLTSATGTNAAALARSATASGTSSLAIGLDASSTATDSAALGTSSSSTGSASLALGKSSIASQANAIAIGNAANAGDVDSIALGTSSNVESDNSIAIGKNSSVTGGSSTAIGLNSVSAGGDAIAAGKEASASGNYATALGYSSDAQGARSIAIGNATTKNNDAIAIGDGASADTTNTIAIGKNAVVESTATNSIAIGNTVTVETADTIKLGNSTHNIQIDGTLETLNIEDVEDRIIQDAIKLYDVMSTGVLEFDGITVTSGSTFTIGAGKGYIVDNYTNPLNPEFTFVDFQEQIGLSTPYLATYIMTDVFIDANGDYVLVDEIEASAPDRREMIFLGRLIHPNGVLVAVENIPQITTSVAAQLRDLWRAIGPVNEGVTIFANGANLAISNTAGGLHYSGLNFINDSKSPSRLAIAPNATLSFLYRTQNGSTYDSSNLIQPGFWDNNGTRTSVGNNNATNHRVFLTRSGLFRVQYGQKVYDNLEAAIAAIPTEKFIVSESLKYNSILVGIISVFNPTTVLNNATYANFTNVSKFGEVSGGSGGGGGTAAVNAESIPIADVGNYYTATNVETAFAEVATTKAPINNPSFTGNVSLPKTLSIKDTSGDHSYVFNVNELTANRNVILPLLNSGDTFVFEAHNQTLTNKTLTSPTLTGTVVLPTTTKINNHNLVNKGPGSYTTYYVNTSGNDSNNGLTSGTAFATITKAISMLPDILTQDVFISIGQGVYSEFVSLKNIHGHGTLTVSGVYDSGFSKALTDVLQVDIRDCSARIRINNLNTTDTFYSGFIVFNSRIVEFTNCEKLIPSYYESGAFEVTLSNQIYFSNCRVQDQDKIIAYSNVNFIVSTSWRAGSGNKYYFYNTGSTQSTIISTSGTAPSHTGNSLSSQDVLNLQDTIKTRKLKNWIINGGFDVWQRGIGFSTSFSNPQYTADRWFTYATYAARANFTTGQTTVPNNPKYFMRLETDSEFGQYAAIQQRIEDVTLLSGKTLSLSFWVDLTAGSEIGNNSFSVSFGQNFGTGGSTSVSSTILQQTVTISGWKKYTVTFTAPSVSGKTIGSNNYSSISIINESSPTGFYMMDIANVSLVEGSIAQEWQTEAYVDVLKECQRYYYVINKSAYGSGFVTSTTQARIFVPFPTEMRITPTDIDIIALNRFSLLYSNTASLLSAISLLTTAIGKNGVTLTVTANDTLTVGQSCILVGHVSIDNQLGFNAEL